MLRIKYIENFKANEPFVVVLADLDALQKLYGYLRKSISGANLCDPAITEFCHIVPLLENDLSLTGEECLTLANQLSNLISGEKPGHIYFDIPTLPAVEIIISYLEYNNLF